MNKTRIAGYYKALKFIDIVIMNFDPKEGGVSSGLKDEYFHIM